MPMATKSSESNLPSTQSADTPIETRRTSRTPKPSDKAIESALDRALERRAVQKNAEVPVITRPKKETVKK